MKLSKFNTSVPHEGKFIYHNSLTENFIVLEPLLMELIEASKNEDNVLGLKDIHADLYEALFDQGFILPKEIDELKKAKALIKSVDDDDELYSLMILPTMNCNFKCWYCYETHIKGSKTSETNIQKIKLHIKNKFEEMKSMKRFELSFFGGEPLMYYKDVVNPILEYTFEMANKFKVELHSHFTSNGFLINDEMISSLLKNGVNSFQITLDGFGDDHDNVRYVSKSKGSYSKIIENIKKLVRNDILVTLRINYTQKNIDGIPHILNDFVDLTMNDRSKITLDMQKVWQENELEGIFEKEVEFKKAAREFGLERPPASSINTVRNSCYADKKNQAAINYNGDVYKCNARDFTVENKEGVLNEDGHIVWGEQFKNRMEVKLKNKPCQSCSIMPICGGGCSQYALEHLDEDYCVHNFDEQSKKNVILDMFLLSELPDV